LAEEEGIAPLGERRWLVIKPNGQGWRRRSCTSYSRRGQPRRLRGCRVIRSLRAASSRNEYKH
jgi:hypothetical protein